MKIIRELSELIEEEISDSCKYAKLALEWKDKKRDLADTFYTLSLEEMRHMQMLHNEVTKLIEEHRRTKGEPPGVMLEVYDYLHKRNIEKAGDVKSLQTLYKES